MPVKPSPSCAAVLSGAGGASCCVQRVVLDGALAVVDRLEELPQRLGEPRRVLGELAQLGDLLGRFRQRLLARRRPPRPGPRVEARDAFEKGSSAFSSR